MNVRTLFYTLLIIEQAQLLKVPLCFLEALASATWITFKGLSNLWKLFNIKSLSISNFGWISLIFSSNSFLKSLDSWARPLICKKKFILTHRKQFGSNVGLPAYFHED